MKKTIGIATTLAAAVLTIGGVPPAQAGDGTHSCRDFIPCTVVTLPCVTAPHCRQREVQPQALDTPARRRHRDWHRVSQLHIWVRGPWGAWHIIAS